MKKFNTKIFITGILFIIFFVLNFSFAASISSGSNFKISELLQVIIDILRGIWVLLVILAGKLYTNDLLYGSFLHIDSLFWKIWNFSKTIANFAIGFILIISIILIFFGKTKNIFSIILKLALASILVNKSWFIIGFILDLSTILLSSVGSFPLSLIKDIPTHTMKEIKYCSNPQIGFKLSKDADNPIERFYKCEKEDTINNSEDFLNKMNSMSGPLFFIGASVLNIDKIFGIDVNNIKKGDDIFKVVNVSFVLYFIIIILFIIPIFLLIIIGIFRIFWIWIYIAFSPLIFLDQIFGGKLGAKHKSFEFRNMIGLIFQPVLVVFALGVSVIFLSFLQSAFLQKSDNSQAKKDLGICGKDSKSLCIQDTKILTIKGDFINNTFKDIGGAFAYIILTILALKLLWSMIHLSFKVTDITSSITESVYSFSEQALKQIPIIPTPYGGVGIGAVETALKKNVITKGLETKAAEKSGELTKKIYDVLHIKQVDLLHSEVKTWIEKIASVDSSSYEVIYKVMEEFINYTKTNHPDIIPAHSTNFQKVISAYINKLGKSHNDIYKTLGLKKGNENITNYTEMFKQNDFRRFVTGLIQDAGKLEGTGLTPSILFSDILSSKSDLLNKPIKDIK